ncbi:hypothetical protein OS493_018546 [Desmophyllum pertusum]|uniref:Uncharacterized protein n=1 Tax=Desmophyllum pertusum TaxID=174260 RepID=A0A9X0D8Q9_9CNID|nr:hypothetical protein OS493_018546 [Desmophyllum pertusum]
MKINTHEYETLTLVDEENIKDSSQTETLTDEDIDQINLLLYTKERFNVSNEAYHELSMICKDLPRSWKVRERIKAINSKWNLSSTPGDTCGIQQSIKERLEIRLQALLKNIPSNSALKQNHKIRVKLSGDGTNIGKKAACHQCDLDEGTKAMSADGNHLIAVIKESENYDKLAKALADIRKDVESLKHVSVGTEQFEIEWFLGGDWKFLACICGIGAAHATYPCIWCKCTLISNNLINLLILELQRQDSIDKKRTFNDGFARSKYKHMAGWESYLNDTLKIHFNWFVCKDSKKLKMAGSNRPRETEIIQEH